MKKTILGSFILYTFLYLILNISANAATPSGTLTPKEENPEVISDLKERIASRVAQLKLVEKKGVIGTVSDVSQTQLTVIDLKGNTKFIDVDELTKFSSPSAGASFGISDITKDSKIGIIGLYNKQSRRVLARFIDVAIYPKFLHGQILSIDEDNFALDIVTDDGKQVTVDVEKTTKTLSYTKETDLVRSGFSKITEGERIIVVGFPDIKDKGKIIASRVLVFPGIPKNPKIGNTEQAISPHETIVPSTGSGKKLTPMTR